MEDFLAKLFYDLGLMLLELVIGIVVMRGLR